MQLEGKGSRFPSAGDIFNAWPTGAFLGKKAKQQDLRTREYRLSNVWILFGQVKY
jgi:hypothetical protein